MSFHEFFLKYHTEISLIAGPVLAWFVGSLPKLNVLLRMVIFLVAMFLVAGLYGILLNWWLIIGLVLWYAVTKRKGLTVLYFGAATLAILLIVSAVAFYVYVIITKPGEVLRNLWHPLLFVYFVPGVVAGSFALRIKDLAEEQKRTRALGFLESSEDRS